MRNKRVNVYFFCVKFLLVLLEALQYSIVQFTTAISECHFVSITSSCKQIIVLEFQNERFVFIKVFLKEGKAEFF